VAESSGSAIATYGEGVKWLVGISTAAVGGAFLHAKEIEELAVEFRVLVAVALFLFFVSIWGGVNYLLWLNALGADKERIRENLEKLQSETIAEKRTELQSRIDRSEKRTAKAEKTMPSWHRLYTFAFAGAMLIATGALCSVLLRSQTVAKPMKKSAHLSCCNRPSEERPLAGARFQIVYSAIHQTGHGKEAHTFLLDDETGMLWQMVCAGNDAVALRLVQRIDGGGKTSK
jgi:hypothetical protein